ncbi:MAG: macro domain-containing protein [Chloroflexi bacterium]|nr:macro domain-containing protein [Chloroflexota bacterium]
MSRLVAQTTLAGNTTLRLIHGDLTEEAVDAIVNAANAQLQHGGGVAGAIARRGGAVIQHQSDEWVRRYGPVGHDRPALTDAGALPCRHVIHAVGPIWGEGGEDGKLRAAVLGALELAQANSFASLALPAVSTGIFGFPKDRGAHILLQAVADHCQAHPAGSLREVHVTLIDEPTLRVFAAEFEARWPGSSLPA